LTNYFFNIFIFFNSYLTAGKGGSNIGCIENAFVIGSSVWVAGFGVDTHVIMNVSETLIHKTTSAAEVSPVLGAVYQVLFRKGSKSVSSQSPLSFKTGNSGKGPARSALTLILNKNLRFYKS
jgi:hypothetical protein